MAVAILHLSEKEVSDLLFVSRLGRFLSVAPRHDHRVVIIHDGFYQARTILENDGNDLNQLTPEAWTTSAEHVFNGVKGLTRRIVNSLTDEGIPSIGFQCADRDLIVKEDASLRCNKPDKLTRLTADGVVPVLGPIVQVAAGGMALERAELISRSIAASLASSVSVIVASFSVDGAESVLNSFKSIGYAKSDKNVSCRQIGAETLADTEFWERFS